MSNNDVQQRHQLSVTGRGFKAATNAVVFISPK